MKSRLASGSARVLLIVGGVLLSSCFLCCGGGLFIKLRDTEQNNKKLAEANGQWEAGQKADAMATYKGFIDRSSFPDDAQRGTVYQRVVEYDLERGDTQSAKATVEKAFDRKVELPAGNKPMAELVAQVRAERAQREAEAQAAREAEAKRKQEEREAEAKRKEEERKNAPRLSVEIVKIRLEPYQGATGLKTTMVYVDWKNTGNRPVRWLTVKIEGFAENGREVEMIALPDNVVYSVFHDKPGIASGGTYVTPNGQGMLIPPHLNKQVARVVVTVATVRENGPEEAWR